MVGKVRVCDRAPPNKTYDLKVITVNSKCSWSSLWQLRHISVLIPYENDMGNISETSSAYSFRFPHQLAIIKQWQMVLELPMPILLFPE